jgi:hypothetical protein
LRRQGKVVAAIEMLTGVSSGAFSPPRMLSTSQQQHIDDHRTPHCGVSILRSIIDYGKLLCAPNVSDTLNARNIC